MIRQRKYREILERVIVLHLYFFKTRWYICIVYVHKIQTRCYFHKNYPFNIQGGFESVIYYWELCQ